MSAPRLPSLRPPIAFAHRGARAHADDNTLEAFALALRLGADGLETDAWLTADDVVVLDHDGVIGRRFLGRKPIRALPRAELPEHIPSLDELYEHCGADFELSVDVKDPDVFGPVVDVARRRGAEERLWVCHSDHELLAAHRDDTTCRLVNSTRLSRMSAGPERRAAVLADSGIDAVNLRHTDWTGGLTTLFHRFDRYCLGWDAQQEREVAALLRMGIDGVYGDHVDRLVSVLRGDPT